MDATQDTERWLPVPGFEGSYEVSDLGRIKSVARTITAANGEKRAIRERILKPAPSKSGHLLGAFSVGGVMTTYAVHRVVMLAFVGPRPDGLEVCHNNGDSTDNRLANLRYDTRGANMLDLVRHGNHVQRRKTHCAHGHPFTEDNMWIGKSGKRRCKKCSAFNLTRWKERKKRMKEV